MPYLSHPADAPLREAWHTFCNQLTVAGRTALAGAPAGTELERANALRYLARNLGVAFELALENRDPYRPYLTPLVTPTRKLGGDQADTMYWQAWIDGTNEYVLRGFRGACARVQVSVLESSDGVSLDDPLGHSAQASLLDGDIATDDQGRIEVRFGPAAGSGRGRLSARPGPARVVVRCSFDTWDEQPPALAIERLPVAGPPAPATHDEFGRAAAWASEFLDGLLSDATRSSDTPLHAFHPRADGHSTELACRWQLAPHQGLVVDVPRLPDGYWSITNQDVFGGSLDFRHRPVSYTPSRTHSFSDRSTQLIVSAVDPGRANWLDTEGHTEGILALHSERGVAAFRPPTVRLVPHDGLTEHLRSELPTVSSETRRDEMRRRVLGVRRRYRSVAPDHAGGDHVGR